VKSIPSYVKRSLLTILRVFVIYRPLALFFWTSMIFLLAGLLLAVRFLVYYLQGEGAGHVQSVVLASMLFILAMLLGMMGLIGDLIATNRKLLEQIRLQLQQLEHRR